MKRLFLVFVFVYATFFAAPVPLLAQGDWEIISFHADIHVNQSGGVTVKETITANFPYDKHGIYRDIPVKYRNRYNQHVSIGLAVLGVTDENGRPYRYELSREGAYQRIKIGDPDLTVTGRQTYVIEYEANRVLRYFDDRDELYWNVTGNAWDVPIPQSSATVFLPFAPNGKVQTICFTGETGSTAQDCTAKIQSNEAVFAAHDYLTVAVSWPKGLVQEPKSTTKALWFLGDNFGFLFPLIALAAGYYVWSKRGQDPKGRGVVRQYDAPDKLSPAEMGFLVKQRFATEDVSAEIINLAEQGYLKIHEMEEKGWLKHAKSYELQRIKETPPEKSHQRILLDCLFSESPDNKIKIADLPADFYKEVGKVKDAVWQAIQKKNYFVGKPETAAVLSIVVAIIVGAVLFIIAAVFDMRLDLLVGAVASTIILIIFASLMPKRTEAGVAAYEHAQGFKQYIEAAETERVKWQEKENLFFEVLPYAMVFGIADKWAKAFEGKLNQPPEWYSGTSAAAFSPVHFSQSMNSFSSSTVSHSSPPSSSSSGFGGGGSSGGGGGGGGGGSW